MNDQIEAYGQSLIQHGRSNDRAYLMKIDRRDSPGVVDYALELAADKGYSKIFAKVPAITRPAFLEQGFCEEAKVPGLFNGEEDGFFLSKYLQPDRRDEKQPAKVRKVLAAANEKQVEALEIPVPEPGMTCRIMSKQDVDAMAALYRQVFDSYPFPIDDPDYLARNMDDNVVYHGILQDDELIALASAEIDAAGENVEMTDFATRPDCRGQGLATYLLDRMEVEVRSNGIKTAYTIARAYSCGMNITFAKHDYEFAGTLTNNTQIFGQLESMNVWYKTL